VQIQEAAAMPGTLRWIARFAVRDEGATMLEYALMIALIAMVSLATVVTLGITVDRAFQRTDSALSDLLQ